MIPGVDTISGGSGIDADVGSEWIGIHTSGSIDLLLECFVLDACDSVIHHRRMIM